MVNTNRLEPFSIKDYLRLELTSPLKYEYVDGSVFARPDSTNRHCMIAGNICAATHRRVGGRGCRAYVSGARIRVRLPAGGLRIYYPDACLICRPNSQQDYFHDEPDAIFEVLALETRRIDQGEKKDAYLTIPSLKAYALVEQETAAVTVYRRAESGFVREVYQGLGAVIPLGEVGIELPLAEIYEDTELVPEEKPLEE
jgi:Uma2 family endonuclease